MPAPKVKLNKNQLQIDANGNPGARGSDGSSVLSDSLHGQNGLDGTDGQPGQNGDEIHLSMMHDPNLELFKVSLDPSHAYRISLAKEDPKPQITLNTFGGTGGAGGNGGAGSNGSRGSDGQDAQRFMPGTDGTPGGNGGDGGKGGNGGKGGDGGDVHIEVASQDTDLLMLLNPNMGGGSGGYSGEGGRPGLGGEGGKGGNSFGWDENVEEVVSQNTQYTSSQSQPEYYSSQTPAASGYSSSQTPAASLQAAAPGYSSSQTPAASLQAAAPGYSSSQTPAALSQPVAAGYSSATTRVKVVHHEQIGGRNGDPGTKGAEGARGVKGKEGTPGQFFINAGGRTYAERYNLKLVGHPVIESSDGVIEPGEVLEVRDLRVQNPTEMPTPPKIKLSVVDDKSPSKWGVGFNDRDAVKIEGSVGTHSTYNVPEPIKFTLADVSAPPKANTTLHATAAVRLSAELPRVQQQFAGFMPYPSYLHVHYPVEMSTVANAYTVTGKEEAPFAVQIKNVSTQPLGTNSPSGRPVEISMAASNVPLQLYDVQEDTKHDLSQAFKKNIPLLAPGEVYTFAGTLKFSDGKTPAYTTANLSFDLNLGSLKDNTPQAIQKRTFGVQLAEEYKYDKNAILVLVTNNQVSGATVSVWMNVAEQLGTTLSVWNTSLYSGLSYTQKRSDGDPEQPFVHPMYTEFANRVVVILNNQFQASSDQRTQSVDYLMPTEILDAAAEAGVSTYVVGGRFDMNQAAVPHEEVNIDIETGMASKRSHVLYEQRTVSDSYVKWGKPVEKELTDKAEAMDVELQKRYPTDRHVLVYDFKPENKGGIFTNTWDLGTVQVRRALPLNQAHIAHRPKDDVRQVDEVDIYNVIKLSSFATKLGYLRHTCKQQNKNYADLVTRAILSDLSDELLALGKHTWMGDYSKEKLQSRLELLYQLKKYDLSSLSETPEGKRALAKILVAYEHMASSLEWTSDTLLFPWMKLRHHLAVICKEQVAELLKTHLPAEDCKALRKAFQADHKKLNMEQLFDRYSSPYGRQTQFDNKVELPKLLPRQKLVNYAGAKSSFFEEKNVFKSKEQRADEARKYSAECAFDPAPRR